jgi:hypothetical protein
MADLENSPELIASNLIEGAPVFDNDGARLGVIHALMIDRRSGRVTFAEIRVGGLMGIGSDHGLLPWNRLDFDEDLGGYVLESGEDAPPAAGPGQAVPRFNYAIGAEPIGHYGLEGPDEPMK